MSLLSDSCAKVDELLLDYAYGELEGPPLHEVERHLEGCTRCREQLERMGSVRTAMSALPQEPAPAQGTESLLDYARRAAERPRASGRPWHTWRWLAAALPVGGIVAVVFVAVSQVGGPSALMGPVAVSEQAVPVQRAPATQARKVSDFSEPAPGPAAPAAEAVASAGDEPQAVRGVREAPKAARMRAAKKEAPLSFVAPKVAERPAVGGRGAEGAAAKAVAAPAPRPSLAAEVEEAPAAFAPPPPAAPSRAAVAERAEPPARESAGASRKADADGAQTLLEAVAARKRAGDWAGALRLCERFVTTHPDHAQVPAVLHDRAQLLDRLGRPEEARRVREELVRRHPLSPEAATAREALR